MISSVKTIVKKYAESYNECTSKFQESKRYIDDNYISSGSKWAEKYKEIKELYDAQIWQLQTEAKSEVQGIFSDAVILIRSRVTDEVPQGAISDIELLKESEPTGEDIKSFLEKYKKNYLVCKRLKVIAKERNLDIEVISIDDLLESLEELKLEVLNLFYIYKGPLSSYRAELILNGAIIDRIDKSLDTFYEKV